MPSSPSARCARGRRAASWAFATCLAGASLVAAGGACGSSTHASDANDAAVTAEAGSTTDATSSHDAAVETSDGGAPGDGAGAADGPALPVKSLRDFGAACDGVTNDRDAVAKAFAAAANNAFELVVDSTCSAYIKVGNDITQPIFFADGTSVKMESGGSFILDNASIPTFDIADTSDLWLIDWTIKYIGSLPVDTTAWTSGQYNDNTLRSYLQNVRGVVFNEDAGFASAKWASPTNMSALFDVRGSSSHITITGMTATGGATVDKFIPMMFSITSEAIAGSTVSRSSPNAGPTYVNPSYMTFSNITLDGTYFGWQGQPTNSTFSHITSLHYGDLEGADGGNVGGCPDDGGTDCSFAPPHLFYINEGTSSTLYPHDNTITDVTDEGLRVGIARNPNSGNACSLKFGGVNSTVNGYTSHRPDGLADVLASQGNTIENVTATFDSTFCEDKYPGVRFPGNPYVDLTIKGLSLTDTAAATDHPIFPGDGYPGGVTDASVSGVSVTMNSWTGSGDYVGTFSGATNTAVVDFTVASTPQVKEWGEKNAVTFELGASPSSFAAGGSTTLTWSTQGATSCTASGAWSGGQSTNGTKMLTVAAAGTYVYTLACTDGTDTGTANVTVTVTP